jgi:ATP-dependent Clp protease ATP-binding subunit ClpA
VFERFTERARQVVVLAQDEARGLGHAYIGTEHLLLGVLREEEGIAARTLGSLGVGVDEARTAVVGLVGRGEEQTTAQMPFTARAKASLEMALREATGLGHQYIGTEHVLLGLVRDKRSAAVRLLDELGATPDQVRTAVVEHLGGAGAPASAPRPAYVVLKQVAENRWELVGEVDRRPGMPARKSRAQAVRDAGGDPESGEVYAVLPRSEWRCALDL